MIIKQLYLSVSVTASARMGPSTDTLFLIISVVVNVRHVDDGRTICCGDDASVRTTTSTIMPAWHGTGCFVRKDSPCCALVNLQQHSERSGRTGNTAGPDRALGARRVLLYEGWLLAR